MREHLSLFCIPVRGYRKRVRSVPYAQTGLSVVVMRTVSYLSGLMPTRLMSNISTV